MRYKEVTLQTFNSEIARKSKMNFSLIAEDNGEWLAVDRRLLPMRFRTRQQAVRWASTL